MMMHSLVRNAGRRIGWYVFKFYFCFCRRFRPHFHDPKLFFDISRPIFVQLFEFTKKICIDEKTPPKKGETPSTAARFPASSASLSMYKINDFLKVFVQNRQNRITFNRFVKI